MSTPLPITGLAVRVNGEYVFPSGVASSVFVGDGVEVDLSEGVLWVGGVPDPIVQLNAFVPMVTESGVLVEVVPSALTYFPLVAESVPIGIAIAFLVDLLCLMLSPCAGIVRSILNLR